MQLSYTSDDLFEGNMSCSPSYRSGMVVDGFGKTAGGTQAIVLGKFLEIHILDMTYLMMTAEPRFDCPVLST